MACFSFYPGKNLGAYGEGGAVTTSNSEYARTIRMLRDWGQDRKYHHVLHGFNYRMEAFQGAILRVKLRHLERWTEARRAIVEQVQPTSGRLRRWNGPRKCHGPVTSITSTRCDRIVATFCKSRCKKKGIQTGIHYAVPVHLQPAYANLGYGRELSPAI